MTYEITCPACPDSMVEAKARCWDAETRMWLECSCRRSIAFYQCSFCDDAAQARNALRELEAACKIE
jgi:hypothetical protein